MFCCFIFRVDNEIEINIIYTDDKDRTLEAIYENKNSISDPVRYAAHLSLYSFVQCLHVKFTNRSVKAIHYEMK